MLIIIPVPEISNIQVYIGYYISASTTHFFKMSVSSEDVTHVQLFNDMMSKFGEFHFSFLFYVVMILYSQRTRRVLHLLDMIRLIQQSSLQY